MIEWHGSDRATLGNRIAAARVRGGMQQIELARRAGLTQLALGEIEWGLAPCSPEMLSRLAQVLKVTLYELRGNPPAL